MDSSDITKCLLIIIIFLAINFFFFFSFGLKSIQDNSPKYRCNPLIMPFAKFFHKNPQANFKSCIQNIQDLHMTTLLDPVYHMMNTLSSTGEEIMSGVTGFSGNLNSLKFNLGSTASLAIDIVINVLIELQAIIIKFKDMINKLVGVFVTFIYLIAGTETTVVTLWNALPGWIIKKVAGYN